MRGDEVIENGTILIDGDRIAAVGQGVAIPPAPTQSTFRARPSFPA
jgi:imidazolonepropionase-like amidohydrolase